MPALEQHLIYRNRILTYSRLLMQLYCTCDKIFVVIIFIQNYTVLGRFKKTAAACCCVPAACWCVPAVVCCCCCCCWCFCMRWEPGCHADIKVQKYTEDNHSVYKTILLCRNRRFRILPYKIDVYKRNNTTQYTIITLPLKLQHVNSMFSLNLFDKSLYENIAGE